MSPSSDTSRPKILCVEDEPELREELVEELNAMGYDVQGAGSAKEAAILVRRTVPDLILCDIMMPESDGFDVLAEIRQDPALEAIPFVFLTALTDRDHQLHGRKAGADDYLPKPVDFDILDAVIRSKLDMVLRIKTARSGAPAPEKVQVHLSRRETQVLRELGNGMKIADIALVLEISEHTVGQYVKAVYSKLDISSRAEAAREAIRRRLLD